MRGWGGGVPDCIGYRKAKESCCFPISILSQKFWNLGLSLLHKAVLYLKQKGSIILSKRQGNLELYNSIPLTQTGNIT